MFRTQISLSEQERALLARATASTGRSMASLIREAVRSRWGGEPVDPDDLQAIDAAFGTWGVERADGEAWVDALRSGRRVGGDG